MKKDKYKVVIAGLAHVHINDVAKHFADNPRIDLCACADTVPIVKEIKVGPYTREWNVDYCCNNYGLKRYCDYRQMLDEEKPDLCVVNAENAYHVEITEECAKRGIGVCIEKPMATTLSDGLKMYRIVQTYGTLMMVNWPITWNAGMHTIKRLIDSGKAGEVIEIKTRMGHTGPLGPGAKHKIAETAAPMTETEKARTWWHQHVCGGGAMADYCCYGSILAYWFAGCNAVAVNGMRINSITTMGDAEDNAAMMVRFPNCYALLEGTWTTYNHTFKSPIVYCTKGEIVGDYKSDKVIFYNTEGGIEEIPNEPLPKKLIDISEAYVHHMDTSEPLHCTTRPEFNLDALALLDAGIRSSDSGKTELVDNIHWRIG